MLFKINLLSFSIFSSAIDLSAAMSQVYSAKFELASFAWSRSDQGKRTSKEFQTTISVYKTLSHKRLKNDWSFVVYLSRAVAKFVLISYILNLNIWMYNIVKYYFGFKLFSL